MTIAQRFTEDVPQKHLRRRGHRAKLRVNNGTEERLRPPQSLLDGSRGRVESRELLFEGLDDAVLFSERRQSELDPFQFRRTQRVQTARRLSHAHQLQRNQGRVPQELQKLGVDSRRRTNPDQVVLMNRVWNGTFPGCRTPDLIRAPVPFHDQQVARLQTKTFDLPVEQLNFMDLGKVQRPAPHVGNSQERKLIFNRSTLGLLLNSPLTSQTWSRVVTIHPFGTLLTSAPSALKPIPDSARPTVPAPGSCHRRRWRSPGRRPFRRTACGRSPRVPCPGRPRSRP